MIKQLCLKDEVEKEALEIELEMIDKPNIVDFERLDSELEKLIKEYEAKKKAR